ncbi:hypothetical protein E1B28_002894 [Marasmius oreades]|uniref:Uncharacterized protein n=1 Tax=Marasmius oreades TaxID=181124 RepID=A0A9P7RKT6_9AGAR|nr:uncharacterized protein E1B28_002894 [Marasmius oreades]KAG7085327.1 hypothetical protein E1B28_002894 [Marasmius oreades]
MSTPPSFFFVPHFPSWTRISYSPFPPPFLPSRLNRSIFLVAGRQLIHINFTSKLSFLRHDIMTTSFRQFLPVLLLITFAAALPLPSSNFPSMSWFLRREKPTVCNGHAEFCDRRYSDVTFIGSHDSFAFSKNPIKLGRDQTVDITAQLEMGVRMSQAQAHDSDDGVLKFCHTDCIIFDGGSVEDYLKTVKSFLDKNPNKVLTPKTSVMFGNPSLTRQE